MSNRYLYRAKRKDNGEWVEGYYACYMNKYGPEYRENHTIRGGKNILYFVDPSTLCQCTGLNDMDGNLIWEKDVCIINGSGIDEEDGYFVLEWDDSTARFVFEGDCCCVDFDNIYENECEVIGNVFDNPDLLEVEE